MSNLSLLLLLQLRIKTKTELKKQMKKISITLLLCLLCLTGMAQGQKALDLKDITSGRFRPENIQGVIPMPDGEHYTQMNDDGTQIIKYSFKTGEKVEVIFDVKTARECDFKHFDSYQFSPDGKKLLIATKTTPIYRHSYTAVHYIYPLKRNDKGVTTNNIIERLSDGGPQHKDNVTLALPEELTEIEAYYLGEYLCPGLSSWQINFYKIGRAHV